MQGPRRTGLPTRTREAYRPAMRFQVLGPLEVTDEHGPLTLGGPRQRVVLANLIVRANQVVPLDTVVDLVWGEDPPESARNVVQTYVSRLRKILGADRLEGRAPGYILHLEPSDLDAWRFEQFLHEARSVDGQADRAAPLLREALGLWRGSAYADLSGEGSLAGEIARLDDLRLQALEERIEADIACGRYVEVLGELETLTHEHPLRERLWAHLILALYRAGRQTDALATYQRLRELLADELGVDPSPDLRSLHERILRQDPDLDLQGEPLRGYRLLDQVGEGAFGVVHRATQPQIGREVAIKAVHPELANHPDFVRRFEHEAQIVARLEHPHIVPLYDYWREPNGAFLVMRFLRGGSVEELLEAGPLEPSRVVSILEQIASALAAAHRQGVVHRDVKPGNILLDEEGNAYLTDFGVALDAGSPERSSGTMMRGTPAYLSPEQIRLDPASPRSDIYALGIVAYEMLTGKHPFPETSLTALLDRHVRDALPSVRDAQPQLPPGVDDVIARSTAKDASQRFADVVEVATELRAALEGTPVAREPSGVRNPYKGLRAFLEADALDFFGREAVTKRLVRRLAEDDPAARFLAVVGPSGSGKSSVVRAGLIPALRRGAIPGSERWYVIEVLPGRHPMREIETALLGVAVEPPPSLMEVLETDELGLVRAIDRVLPDPGAELVMVVDQLEEIFTLVEDDLERAHVLGSLRAAALEPQSRLRVVTTLRADFYDAPLSVPGFGELLAARTEAITPMRPEELERAIVAPADRAGLVVEPRLLAEMIADVADRPGALPLLQYALTELAERAEDGVLSLEAYRRIGRVSGALARRAEQLFEPLNEPSRDACRQLFLRLVTLGEGTEDTRHRVRHSELLTLAETRAMDAVIETYGRHRLLSFDRDPDTREPTVEIAHEALLREWARLRGWIEASRDDLRLHAKISSATYEWDAAGRDADYLLTGARLAQVEETSGDDAIRLTETERAYVDASVAYRDEQGEAERVRLARETQLERRSRMRLRGLVAVLTAGLLVAASLTAVAASRSRDSERSRDKATVLGLTGAALSNLKSDPDLSLRLALHAVDLSSELGEPVPAETVEALHWTLQESGIQYPDVTAPVVRVTSPFGYRGVFDLPVSDLANLGLAHVNRSQRSDLCAGFFGTEACPALPSRFSADLGSEPLDGARPDAQPPLAGTTVTLNLSSDPFELAEVRAELQGFAETTGIDVQLVGNPDQESWLDDVVAAGNPPDVAEFPQPGAVAKLAQEGRLMDLGSYLDADRLRRELSPYLISLGSVGSDGSWPSNGGSVYGVFDQLFVNSLIWYPVPEFRSAGYAIPSTWNELVSLTDRLVAGGRTPWCMGWFEDKTPWWPGTDWIENLLLAGAGPEIYDQWTFHEIPFDAPPVRAAFDRLGEIVFAKDSLERGPQGVLETFWGEAQLPMMDDRPGCWLYQFGSLAAQWLPEGSVETETTIFPFPTIGGRPLGVLGAGDMLAAFTDRPEVREVVRFLISPEFGTGMAAHGHGYLSPNRRVDPSIYPPFWRKQAELIQGALTIDTFRLDASDLMPVAIGQGAFWGAMRAYLDQGPGSVDRILEDIEASWPDGGG